MASAKTLKRIQNLVWILIYGGLLSLLLGVFTRRTASDLGWTLMGGGSVSAAVGAVLIYVRSCLRLTES